MSLTYKDSGVDVEGGNRFVKRIAPIVKKTFSDRVITGIGGFGALFDGSFKDMKEPVLVSGTDGVGTKLKIAQKMNIHDTIGIDAVAMCVNDIIVSGAKPLFFLDYISCGRLNEDVVVDIVKGIAEGCRQSECSLIGGETAEHPNVMNLDDYDIAGFSVGVVDKEKIVDGSKIGTSDVLIGLPSTGVHSNGFSMVRKLFFNIKKYDLNKKFNDLNDTLGKTLITPTRIYTRQIISCLEKSISIKGIVHVTGGGFYENIPRILPENTTAKIDLTSFNVLPIFQVIQKEGDISQQEMFTTFNMGIGMIVVVASDEADKALSAFKDTGEKPVIIGEITESTGDPVLLQ